MATLEEQTKHLDNLQKELNLVVCSPDGRVKDQFD
jgi:hypothetical protein